MMILTKAVMLRARAWGTAMHARVMEKELRCDRVLGFGAAVSLGDPRRVHGLIIETLDYRFSWCT